MGTIQNKEDSGGETAEQSLERALAGSRAALSKAARAGKEANEHLEAQQ